MNETLNVTGLSAVQCLPPLTFPNCLDHISLGTYVQKSPAIFWRKGTQDCLLGPLSLQFFFCRVDLQNISAGTILPLASRVATSRNRFRQ